MIPREDISKKLKPEIFKKYAEKAWQKRNEAATDIEAILVGAKMRIKPDGLGDVMTLLQNANKDGNKAVIKAFMVLSGKMSEALGESIARY
jgi:hypothetical protein